jgi:hypothetical protein
MHNTSGVFSHKSSNTYASKIAIAQALAGMSARAVTITSVARTKPADSRAIYKSITGAQSQSGQTPTNHEWFLGSRPLRMHGAMLLLMYALYREQHKNSDDAHGIAFTLTLYNYQLMYGRDALISPERMVLLISHGFGIGWRDITKGGPSRFPADNVKVMRCRTCKLPHLVEAHFISYVCGECASN